VIDSVKILYCEGLSNFRNTIDLAKGESTISKCSVVLDGKIFGRYE
jgi:hypothetical protein